ncbi:hypothetical protein D3C76_1472120 [compost metagenome]
MEITLPTHILTDLAQEALEMREEGRDSVDQEAYVREQLTSVYDDRIWEMVDSEENEELNDPYTFDEVVYELTDDIMSRVDYYESNRD